MNKTYEDAIISAVAKLKTSLPCCPNCFNFDDKKEECELARGQRPPAQIIAFGCPAFDLMPF